MHFRSRRSIAPLLLLSGVATLAACSANPTGSSSEGPTLTTRSDAAALPGLEAPSWATKARYAGRLATGTPVAVQVHLQMRDVDGALTELQAISDPKSPRYGQFLSDADFAARYAPTEADAAAVRAHLESHGLRVTAAPGNRAFLAAQGTAEQIEQAFGTRLGTYQVEGELRRAPLDEAKLPDDVASRVASVMGLASASKMRPMIARRPVPAAKSPVPAAVAPTDTTAATCSTYYGQATQSFTAPFAGYPGPYSLSQCNGYTPPQVRGIYGLEAPVRAGTDGRGQTVAIVDAYQSPTLVQDAQQYAANNDPQYPFAAAQFVGHVAPGSNAPPPTQVDLDGWYGEQTMDVQAVHAIAPRATIAYVEAASDDTTDMVAAVNLVITDHLATIVSGSWGEEETISPASDFSALGQVILQGSLKGIEFAFGSGDWGDGVQQAAITGTTTVPSAFFPSSLPYVTSVGGTSVGLGKNNQTVFELGWENGASVPVDGELDGTWLQYLQGINPTFDADAGSAQTWWPSAPGGYDDGAGGGASSLYAEPWYQLLGVPSSLSSAGGKSWRVTPDVSMLADSSTGFRVGETFDGTYFEAASGGTSLATPLFAALVALTQQAAGRGIGFVNPLVYATAPLGTVRDVRPGRGGGDAVYFPSYGFLITFDYRGPENTNVTTAGYDTVTGLGSPNGAQFIGALGLLGKL